MPMIVIHMAYLRTKLEQSSFSHFRDMKEDPKRKTTGDLGWSASLKVIDNHHHHHHYHHHHHEYF